MGLKEHPGKAQFYHRTAQGRRALRDTECAAFTFPELTTLGVTIGSSQRNTSTKEQERLQKATTVALKSRGLPTARQVTRHLCASASASARRWGWVQKGPPKRAVQRIEAQWRRVGSGLTCASAKLLKLLTGHHSDLEFSACLHFFSSVWRFVRDKGRCYRNWDTFSVAQRLFDSLGFHNPEPWVWDGPARVSLVSGSLGVLQEQLHFIREAWRAKMWRTHEESGRRDTTGEPYDEALSKRARQMAERGQHHLAILSGAYVSWSRFSIMKQDPDLASCPRCGNVGSKAHAWWECPGRPNAGRGIVFRSSAQQFLAWPTGDPVHDDRVLEAIVAVRKVDLGIRYNHAPR